jgi:hypothetical protein
MDANLNHIEQLEAGLTLKQVTKLEAVRRSAEIALARQYGSRLSPIVTDMLVKDMILRPDVLAHLEGATVAELPSDTVGRNRIACELVDADELAQRNLSFNDAELRQRLRNEVLASISPQRRISLAREGKLDELLEKQVEQALDAQVRR